MSSQPNLAGMSLPRRSPRIWPAIAMLVVFWAIYSVWRWTDLGPSLGFLGFLILLAVCAVTMLVFVIWWLAASRVTWLERFAVLAIAIAAAVGTGFFAHRLLGPFLLLPGISLVLTAWTLALLAVRRWSPLPRGLALAGAVCLTAGAFLLLRAEGMEGDGQLTLRWRWTPTPEDAYVALPRPSIAPVPVKPRTQVQAGDWAEFRGPDRDGDFRGVRISADWVADPPRLVWKRPIGPAWSSIAVVGDRLFTQEQVGPSEAVVCLDVATGRVVWSHEDPVRHEDVQGGAGPRATPTCEDRRIYALGATGLLNVLDAETGNSIWQRDINVDAEAKTPMWGHSSSPLVIGDRVIVFAGGEAGKSLLAYETATGKLAWSADAGQRSYNSPQPARIGGQTQILLDSEKGLMAFDPATGALNWEHPTPAGNPGVPRSIQPHLLRPSAVLFDAGPDLGTGCVDVQRHGESWKATLRWMSPQLKSSFNDFVVVNEAIYGFDNRIFTCIDAKTGQRLWKGGRYGSGQVVALGDQPLLMAVSEEGEIVLVAADPKKHRELGRFQAVAGKTWSPPTIAHGRLYVRNAQEIACYELKIEGPP